MSGLVDTNVLLYAVNSDAEEHVPARTFLEAALAGSEAWYLTEGIVYEFLRVATHARVFPIPLDWRAALGFVSALWAMDRFRILGTSTRHWGVLEDILASVTHAAGNLFFDIRTVALMREHGVRRIYTADTDFLQFEGIEVINPI